MSVSAGCGIAPSMKPAYSSKEVDLGNRGVTGSRSGEVWKESDATGFNATLVDRRACGTLRGSSL